MKIHHTLLPLLLLSSNSLFADVEIQMKDMDSNITTFWIGSSHVKMETADTSGYVIVDVKGQKQFMIDHLEKLIIDVSEDLASTDSTKQGAIDSTSADPKSADIQFNKIGSGPNIAGFTSEEYEVRADGALCSKEFLSTEPFKHPEIVQLLEVIAMMDTAEIDNSQLYDPCEQAELSLELQYKSLGIPLRSMSPDGITTSEVIHFQVSQAPKGTYDFPDGYGKTTLRQLLNEQMQNMSTGGHNQ